jgi:prepilin-type processing-associated H-X9-DG protein
MTVLELLAVVALAIVAGIVLLPVVSPRRHGCGGRQMRDATMVRGIQQSMAIWANQNQGLYPVPSKIDGHNTTVAELGTAKDTTANILSVLIYTGGISVEMCVSYAECNTGGVVQDDDYEFDVPKKAVDPSKALWDPAFTSDFTNGKVSNNSYAHVLPGGGREKLWGDTFSGTEPIVGNRGPEVKSLTRDRSGKASVVYALASSNTFLIHGSRSSWEGNIAYNDGHVNFETSTLPEGTTYKTSSGKSFADCLFFDEPDDANGTNGWMSIWTTAGDAKKDFTPIWD